MGIPKKRNEPTGNLARLPYIEVTRKWALEKKEISEVYTDIEPCDQQQENGKEKLFA
jgi:hypothetical protein